MAGWLYMSNPLYMYIAWAILIPYPKLCCKSAAAGAQEFHIRIPIVVNCRPSKKRTGRTDRDERMCMTSEALIYTVKVSVHHRSDQGPTSWWSGSRP